jgi:hypothetical protein
MCVTKKYFDAGSLCYNRKMLGKLIGLAHITDNNPLPTDWRRGGRLVLPA